MVVNNLVKGRGKPKCVGDVLQCGGSGSTSFWVIDVDYYPPHGRGNWGVSTQVSYMDHWETAPAVSGCMLLVTTFGDGDAGVRV